MMTSTQEKVCVIALSLIGYSSFSFSVESLFDTPQDMEPTFVDDVLDMFGADGGFDSSKKWI
ncbi:hypothetical protein H5300_20470 [Vibrio sp. SG41-7]|uniref:hypothetical protein n=1 Tax=Vibrio sp. SG41-7 TaxID=2760973 RepID=UPI0015FF44EC|nr:hypothetical protein [Vibrio sp. SG41-7]MBB1465648.1 hypothetical protein [Vibrio sp. SG41-7]